MTLSSHHARSLQAQPHKLPGAFGCAFFVSPLRAILGQSEVETGWRAFGLPAISHALPSMPPSYVGCAFPVRRRRIVHLRSAAQSVGRCRLNHSVSCVPPSVLHRGKDRNGGGFPSVEKMGGCCV